MAPQQFSQALSDDFGNILDSQNFSDVRIVIEEVPNIRTFYAHLPILAARSPYFCSIVFNSEDFTSLTENALSLILTRDDLNIEESEIWEKIVEWGVAKLDNNIQTKNVLYWTDENFHAFKESIERLLPLIRFFNISSVDFYHKVKPFVRILLGTLYEDLLHHYLIPSSHQNSRDGFTPADFHRLCDDKGATVTLIKVKGTGQLIGGYNPQLWHTRDEFLGGKGSFIFSLGAGKAGNAKLSKCASRYGPYDGPNHKPSFGNDNIRLIGNFKSDSWCSC
ncbi:hypothetical protein G9A89_008485 [Geosiphon pyriformis]|nr:hypothetical protein G9A89_008485 [Geosiphon pyriformis]